MLRDASVLDKRPVKPIHCTTSSERDMSKAPQPGLCVQIYPHWVCMPVEFFLLANICAYNAAMSALCASSE